VAEQAFAGAIDMVTKPGAGDGCLLVHGALASGPTAGAVRAHLAHRRQGAEAVVCQRLERAKSEGDLPPDSDPAALANFLMTMIWGLSVQAAGGATRDQLRQAADAALLAWPT